MRLRLHLAAAATVLASAATTRYVSSSSGDDAADGASPATAWRTLPRAAQGVGAGDSLLLRDGDAFDLAAPLVLRGFGSGVNDGARPAAVLGHYGDDGSGRLQRPWVRRAAGASAAGPVLQFVDSVGVGVVGLEVSGGEQGLLFSWSAPGASNGGVLVEDCFLHHIRGLRPGGDPSGWGSGVGLNASARADVSAFNISVVHNVFNDSDVAYQNCITAQTHGGCVWQGAGNGGYVNTDGVLFASNLVNHVDYNAAFFAFTRNTLVDSNVFLNDRPSVLFPLGTTDIIVGQADATVVLTRNEIANRGEVPSGPDGCGIDLEDSSDGVELSFNRVSNTYAAAFLLYAGTGSGSKNLVLRNNTLLACGCNQTSGDHGVIAFLHAGQTGTVSGNTLADCGGSSVVYNGDTSGFAFSDNAILAASSLPALIAPTPVVAAAPAGDGALAVSASCALPGATLRYSLDGSRPTESSTPWPAGGLVLRRSAAVLVKAFAPGLIESAVAGGAFGPARA